MGKSPVKQAGMGPSKRWAPEREAEGRELLSNEVQVIVTACHLINRSLTMADKTRYIEAIKKL